MHRIRINLHSPVVNIFFYLFRTRSSPYTAVGSGRGGCAVAVVPTFTLQNVSSNLTIFSDTSERNNDYSDTLDFRRGWMGEFKFFVLKVPDYESAMLIYLYIYMYKKLRYRSQFSSDFREIHMVGAGLLAGEPYCFWKQSTNRTTDMGENVLPKPVFRV